MVLPYFGDSYERGILMTGRLWLAHHAPLNRYMTALLQLVIGGLTGLDGSGFSGLPLTGAWRGPLAQLRRFPFRSWHVWDRFSAILFGGGNGSAMGTDTGAAICNVDPVELARKNMLPVFIGLTCTFLVACLVL